MTQTRNSHAVWKALRINDDDDDNEKIIISSPDKTFIASKGENSDFLSQEKM